MKPRLIPKLAAILPSVLVAVVHFTLSVRVAPHANVVFQRWFDTGEVASGADALVASVDRFLSVPIPAVLFAGHPVHGLLWEWWAATIVNSLIWGGTVYALYLLTGWLLMRFVQRRGGLTTS